MARFIMASTNPADHTLPQHMHQIWVPLNFCPLQRAAEEKRMVTSVGLYSI